MIDTRDLKSRVNLLDLVGGDTRLSKIAGTRGGEYAGPCPFCGGDDRLRVQPEQGLWWCRACSPSDHWQDAISYVMRRDGSPFGEAVRVLGGDAPLLRTGGPRIAIKRRPEPPRVPSEAWSARARIVADAAIAALWAAEGAPARAYLHERGLNDDTLRSWEIGYQRRDQYDAPDAWGLTSEQTDRKKVWVPAGIVIPWVFRGTVWGLKVRRAQDDPKYRAVKMSIPVLFGADRIQDRSVLVMAEGEFDTLLAWQEVGKDFDVASLGGAGKSVDPRAGLYMLAASTVLAAYDGDDAGREGMAKLHATSARVRRIEMPDGQDLTDYHRAGGDIGTLLRAALPPTLAPTSCVAEVAATEAQSFVTEYF